MISEKEIWTRRRKLLNPTFHQHKLQNYAPAMNKQSRKIVEDIKFQLKSTGLNVFNNLTNIISRRIMNMLLETVLDFHENDIDLTQFISNFEMMEESMCRRIEKPWNLLPILDNFMEEGKLIKKVIQLLQNESRKVIEFRIQKLKLSKLNSNQIDSNDKELTIKPALIDALINDHENNPEITTLEDIVDEVGTFLGAGWDTSTLTTSFVLMQLGSHPDVQEKVFQEITSTVSDINELTMAETMNLKYLDCVINESMRHFAPISFIGRRTEKDIAVTIDEKQLIIPKGVDIMIDSDLLHHNPRYWSEPKKFIPERFLPENSKNRDPYSFIPYSTGPRSCIGKSFGIMEEKIIIAQILNSFVIRTIDPIESIRMDNTGMARRTCKPIKFELYPRVDSAITL